MADPDKTVVTREDQAELRLTIDRMRLEEEWEKHSQQYYVWAMKVADAQAAYDSAKSARDLKYAETAREIRTSPLDYGLEKPTDKSVAEVVEIQPDYVAVNRAVNKACLLYTSDAADE